MGIRDCPGQPHRRVLHRIDAGAGLAHRAALAIRLDVHHRHARSLFPQHRLDRRQHRETFARVRLHAQRHGSALDRQRVGQQAHGRRQDQHGSCLR